MKMIIILLFFIIIVNCLTSKIVHSSKIYSLDSKCLDEFKSSCLNIHNNYRYVNMLYYMLFIVI